MRTSILPITLLTFLMVLSTTALPTAQQDTQSSNQGTSTNPDTQNQNNPPDLTKPNNAGGNAGTGGPLTGATTNTTNPEIPVQPWMQQTSSTEGSVCTPSTVGATPLNKNGCSILLNTYLPSDTSFYDVKDFDEAEDHTWDLGNSISHHTAGECVLTLSARMFSVGAPGKFSLQQIVGKAKTVVGDCPQFGGSILAGEATSPWHVSVKTTQ